MFGDDLVEVGLAVVDGVGQARSWDQPPPSAVLHLSPAAAIAEYSAYDADGKPPKQRPAIAGGEPAADQDDDGCDDQDEVAEVVVGHGDAADNDGQQ